MYANNINGDGDMKQEFKPQEFARLIGRDKSTLLRWHKENKFVPYRIDGSDRFYSLQQLKNVMGNKFDERLIMDREELLEVIDKLENKLKSYIE